MKKAFGLGLLLGHVLVFYGQDTLAERKLETITIGVNKWQQNINEVPNKITKINRTQILHNNPQTAADMLAQTGTVFVQKSQLGGGSPMIRGFATNRVLLVVDGIRMNNAIYRSGNLQNVISIDALSTENAEVIFGPGSLIYGSDAIGGVMYFQSLQPRFSTGKKNLFSGSAITRYSSANQEKTVHADLNIAGRKLSVLGAFTYSDFEDLRMGKNGGQDSYLRQEYVQRINGMDSIVKNDDPRVQRFTGYTQTNFLGKLRYRPVEHLDLQYQFTYANTGNAPRFDRLIQYRNGRLRFAEWNYGPMVWRMHQVQALLTKKTALADQVRFIAAFQDYEESRIDRARGNNNRTTQAEDVLATNLNVDAMRKLGGGELFYGLEFVYNKVGSTGIQTNIVTGGVNPFNSRYPDGTLWSTSGIYASYKRNLTPRLTLTTGLRYSYNMMDAEFDTTFIKFPYQKTEIRDGALTGNAGLVFRPESTWMFHGHFSTGYRMPNVDDIGKLFESTPGNITVPNPGLDPEYAWNFELGMTKDALFRYRLEINAFHSILDHAIVRRPYQFNGKDSILFDNTMSRVEALQNVARATVWGLQAGARVYFHRNLYLQANANWITGRETDDVKNEQVPLRHAPPFYGSAHLNYRKSRWQFELYAQYNSQIRNEDLAPSEQSKTDIYAKDEQGRPYAPSWYSVNAKGSYRVTRFLQVTGGWENMTNQRYRPYSSGIAAAGSNLIVSLRAHF